MADQQLAVVETPSTEEGLAQEKKLALGEVTHAFNQLKADHEELGNAFDAAQGEIGAMAVTIESLKRHIFDLNMQMVDLRSAAIVLEQTPSVHEH